MDESTSGYFSLHNFFFVMQKLCTLLFWAVWTFCNLTKGSWSVDYKGTALKISRKQPESKEKVWKNLKIDEDQFKISQWGNNNVFTQATVYVPNFTISCQYPITFAALPIYKYKETAKMFLTEKLEN